MTTTARTAGLTEVKLASGILENRQSLTFFNKHATAILYVRDSKGVSVGNGIPIYPTGALGITKREDGDSVTQEWWGISDTATTGVVVFEGFDT